MRDTTLTREQYLALDDASLRAMLCDEYGGRSASCPHGAFSDPTVDGGDQGAGGGAMRDHCTKCLWQGDPDHEECPACGAPVTHDHTPDEMRVDFAVPA
jgi:hypothetical protein